MVRLKRYQIDFFFFFGISNWTLPQSQKGQKAAIDCQELPWRNVSRGLNQQHQVSRPSIPFPLLRKNLGCHITENPGDNLTKINRTERKTVWYVSSPSLQGLGMRDFILRGWFWTLCGFLKAVINSMQVI
jgi:hypothetical protein